jgi:hypothetical protein
VHYAKLNQRLQRKDQAYDLLHKSLNIGITFNVLHRNLSNFISYLKSVALNQKLILLRKS